VAVNDLDQIKAILDRAGVVYHEQPSGDRAGSAIVITAKDGPNNEGYAGFNTVLDFDPARRLMKVGCWE
jgi:hypothetical protein